MSYFQLLNPKVVAHVATLRNDSCDRPVEAGDVKIVLTGRQFLKYYAARHCHVESMLLWPTRQSNRPAAPGKSPQARPPLNNGASNNQKENQGDEDHGQEIEI